MYAAALPFQGPWIISLIHAAKGVYFQPKPPATPYYTRYSMLGIACTMHPPCAGSAIYSNSILSNCHAYGSSRGSCNECYSGSPLAAVFFLEMETAHQRSHQAVKIMLLCHE